VFTLLHFLDEKRKSNLRFLKGLALTTILLVVVIRTFPDGLHRSGSVCPFPLQVWPEPRSRCRKVD